MTYPLFGMDVILSFFGEGYSTHVVYIDDDQEGQWVMVIYSASIEKSV